MRGTARERRRANTSLFVSHLESVQPGLEADELAVRRDQRHIASYGHPIGSSWAQLESGARRRTVAATK